MAADVWKRLGAPKQYIEPFCGSAAILLAAPVRASLEVVCDVNGFIANFWRATKYQPDAVAFWADYPVSHIDMGAAHIWLMEQRNRIGADLLDIEWQGDAKAAGRWLHGQCCWIGSGWCDWDRTSPISGMGKVPNVNAGFGGGVGINGAGPARRQRREGHTGHGEGDDATSAGMGIQAMGKVPHASNAGRGIQAMGQVPHASNAGMGIQAMGKVPHASDAGMGYETLLTSSGRAAWVWLHKLADRLERVRVVHGDWSRCLNNHFGGNDTAVFLDPPYRAYEKLYGTSAPVADAVEGWARDNAHLRIALCGHADDYGLPGWDAVAWDRGKLTYSGGKTTDKECVWYSPACLPRVSLDLFAGLVA